MTALRALSCPCARPRVTETLVSTVEGREIVRCDACGLLRTKMAPIDTMAVYLDGYHARPGFTPYVERFGHDQEVGRLRLGAHGGPFRDVLDVGAANGGFLAAAVAAGIRAVGLEPNPWMAQFAFDSSGAPVFTTWADLDRAFGGSPKFDLVTYHDVIEHVADPNEQVQRARRFLRAKGVLVLDTPDADHPLLWERHVKPAEHLFYFGEAQLRRLLTRNEMHVQRVERPIPGKLVAYATRRPGKG